MQKEIILILMLVLISSVSAIDLNVKDTFAQGETFYATLEGDINSVLSQNNVIFYRGHTRVPIEATFLQINNTYYISAQLLGKQPGNYSIEIQDLEYIELREQKTIDLVKNFTISEDIADFIVEPELIITESDFKINLENLVSSQIEISSDSWEGVNSFKIPSGENQEIDFSINNLEASELVFIKLSSTNTEYLVPIYIDKEPKQKIVKIDVEPLELIVQMSTNVSYNYSRIIYINNTGDFDLEDISIILSDSLEPYTNLSTDFISEISEGDSVKIGAFFFPNDSSNDVCGAIYFEINSEIYQTLPVFLNMTESYIPISTDNEITENDLSLTKSCEQLNGNVCEDNEDCEGVIENSLNGNCCIGKCAKKESSGSTSKIVGWVLIIGVIAFVVWFYLTKYKGVKPSVDLLKFSRKTPRIPIKK